MGKKAKQAKYKEVTKIELYFKTVQSTQTKIWS
jgi:hypothetical protein